MKIKSEFIILLENHFILKETIYKTYYGVLKTYKNTINHKDIILIIWKLSLGANVLPYWGWTNLKTHHYLSKIALFLVNGEVGSLGERWCLNGHRVHNYMEKSVEGKDDLIFAILLYVERSCTIKVFVIVRCMTRTFVVRFDAHTKCKGCTLWTMKNWNDF